MTMSLILCTIYARSQDYIIHDNSLLIPDVPTPFLQTNPYPLGTTTPCKLEVGKSFNSMSYRAIFYGGNIGVSQSTSTFGNYLGKWSFTGAWQKKTLSGLPVQYTFIPGINYLVNYHRWGDYAAHFGLRATSTTRNDSYPEGISYTEAPQKDAVITWAYETGATPNRLIFQTIEGVDTTVPKPEDVEHEWATILSNGNIGSGTSNPTAQFQIKPLSTPGTPLFDILNGSNSSIFSFFEGSLGGVFNSVGQHSISTPLGVTSGTYKPFSVNNQNGVELFSVRDDANTIINGTLNVYSQPSLGLYIESSNTSCQPLVLRSTSGSLRTLLDVKDNGEIYLPSLTSLPTGSALKNLQIDANGKIVTGNTPYSANIVWETSGNTFTSSGTYKFGNISTLYNDNIDFYSRGEVAFTLSTNTSYGIYGFTSFKRNVDICGGNINTGYSSGGTTFEDPEWSLTVKSSINPYISNSYSSDYNEKGILRCLDGDNAPVLQVGAKTIALFSDGSGTYTSPPTTILTSDPLGAGDVFNLMNSATSSSNQLICNGTAVINNNTFIHGYTRVYDAIVPNSTLANIEIGSSTNSFHSIWLQGIQYTTSDKNLKNDIKDFNKGLEVICKLKPKSYFYNSSLENKRYVGFLAQEVEEIMPEIVYHPKNSEEHYALSYTELIPVLTNAIQEQQRMIDSLRFKLEIIYSSNSIKTVLNPSSQKENINKQPILFQNSPNPFKGITFIDYFIPDNADNAFIKLVDKTGRIIKVFAINNLNFGQLELNCDELTNGTYYYSLLVDGKLIDTKKMLILEKNNY